MNNIIDKFPQVLILIIESRQHCN